MSENQNLLRIEIPLHVAKLSLFGWTQQLRDLPAKRNIKIKTDGQVRRDASGVWYYERID